MNRRTLQVALVAGAAVLAFGVGAATFADALGPGGELTGGGSDLTTDGRSGAGPADDPAPSSGSCDGCFAGGLGLTTAGLVPAPPRSVVLALAAVGAVAVVLLWRRAGRGSDASVATPDASGSGVNSAADGTGTAAVAVDDPPATNPVYRAWLDAVGRIDDGDPQTTAGEYAALAVESGLDDGAVETITALFDRVRYGRATVTDERAERAESAADRLSEEAS